MLQPLDFLFLGILFGCAVYLGLRFWIKYVMINADTNDEEMMEKYLRLVYIKEKRKRL
jgi:hypothetical protein